MNLIYKYVYITDAYYILKVYFNVNNSNMHNISNSTKFY